MEREARFQICPLCEATCGLEVEVEGTRVAGIRGSEADLFSRGYICPKGFSLKELHEDPDRIRTPMIRRSGRWEPVTWAEALAEVEKRLRPIMAEHGEDAVAVYLGNPNVHTLAGQLYLPVLLRALRTRNRFTASTVDQMPKQVAVAMLYGNGLSVPIPDLDRTDYLLVLGANPLVSNGSLMTAPDMPGRLRALRERGGKLVVIDPVRTRTAGAADEHHFIRPGTDAYLLLGILHTLFAEGLAAPGRLTGYLSGWEQVEAMTRPFGPEAVADRCGIDAGVIRRLARELASAPGAAVYGRMGTCTQAHGTLTSWLVELLNIATGNLDREGGTMFPRPAAGGRNTGGTPGKGGGARFGRYRSRVRGLAEVLGELPVACMAEEMETPGPGQIRTLITVGGNPVLSTPNSGRLAQALEGLDLIVSVDLYLNETTRHAHIFLPVPSPLERGHYDIAFSHLAVRNLARYSAQVFPLPDGALAEWEILLALAGIAAGQGSGPEVIHAMDQMTIGYLVQQEVGSSTSPVSGRDPGELMASLGEARGPERLLDWLLRVGPYGEGFGARPDGLSLQVLRSNPQGVDLGPLQPRIPEVLKTRSGTIEAAPEVLTAAVGRLAADLSAPAGQAEALPFLLVGRRDLRSNNSWMHNLPVLAKGPERCTLWIHPADAGRLGLEDGGMAAVASRVGEVRARVEVTADVMRGVVCLPHGWGHDLPGIRLSVAARRPGVNMNRLSDEAVVDPISGNAVLNGIPVAVRPG